MAKKTQSVGGSHDTTILLAPANIVRDLAEQRRNTKKRVQSQNGTFGQAMAKAVEEKHVNRKAHGIACQLDALDDATLHLVYFNLIYYFDVLGIEKRATQQEELFDAGEMAGEPTGMFSDAEDDEKPARGKKRGAAKKAKAKNGKGAATAKNGKSSGHANGKTGARRGRKPGVTGTELAAADARDTSETAGGETKH